MMVKQGLMVLTLAGMVTMSGATAFASHSTEFRGGNMQVAYVQDQQVRAAKEATQRTEQQCEDKTGPDVAQIMEGLRSAKGGR